MIALELVNSGYLDIEIKLILARHLTEQDHEQGKQYQEIYWKDQRTKKDITIVKIDDWR